MMRRSWIIRVALNPVTGVLVRERLRDIGDRGKTQTHRETAV